MANKEIDCGDVQKRIKFKRELCSGCGYCELACSMEKMGEAAPSRALIRLKNDYLRMEHDIFVCQHCEEPDCIEICPVGAIQKDDVSGLVWVDREKCTGCKLCLSCAKGGMFFDEDRGHAVNCDLCQGNPRCVEFCPKNALVF